jgi:hypothetical protein
LLSLSSVIPSSNIMKTLSFSIYPMIESESFI